MGIFGNPDINEDDMAMSLKISCVNDTDSYK